jgi:hypothetical protein
MLLSGIEVPRVTCFRGRSTGYGSLIINTHSFKDVKFTKQYSGPGDWRGSAATVGAGVQGRELFRQAFAQTPPVVIVGGECPVSSKISDKLPCD